MQRVMDYMKERELRPTELFRSFDKAVKSKLTKRQFANRIQVNSRKLRYNTSGVPRAPPFGTIFFAFVQFLAKIMPNNRLTPNSGVGTPSGKS